MLSPMLALRGMVVFEGAIRSISVGRPASILAVKLHLDHGIPLALFPQLDPEEEDCTTARLSAVGTTAELLQMVSLPDGTMRILVQGKERVERTGDVILKDGTAMVATAPFKTIPSEKPSEASAILDQVVALHSEYMETSGLHMHEADVILDEPPTTERQIAQVLSHLEAPLSQQIATLCEANELEQLKAILEILISAIASQRVNQRVQERIQATMEESQKEYQLKEQIKALENELNTITGDGGDKSSLEKRVEDAQMPEAVLKEAQRELARLKRIHMDSAEHTITRTWLEMLADYPWRKQKEEMQNIQTAAAVLGEQHYGLLKVKERILEYLAVRQLNPNSKGPILCLAGPPGVGKTSLGQSIATALGRDFGRIALGGIKDETEIRGHRRTYVGSMPGRVVRTMIRAGSNNPVILLDELDKVGNDFRGDPASALLEVLDPEQNRAFMDHYFDVPVDLSQVLFIATANLTEPIPSALHDRLEVIELPGYTEEEKLQIACVFLLPKLAKNHGLSGSDISFSTAALQSVIRDYTRESGLRGLERQLATVHRKVARSIVEGRKEGTKITPKSITKYLGPVKYIKEIVEENQVPGVATGLAWTAVGGEILFIEAISMKGKPTLKLTGSLGDVMKESAEAAMSWLRANGALLNLTDEAFQTRFHLHVPAGAIPKDGPSAGVTMTVALASLLTKRSVRPNIAMTGEITLRGRIMPVGGIKEKVLAARRAGVSTILIPRHNGNDLIDIPQEIRDELTFHLIDNVEEALALALEPEESQE
jgi:ATP-dependent Lon protease